MDHRSPLENIFNIIGGLPQGHDKPVKHAVYNALALFLLFVCCAALWALYLILEPFFKPLMWALLVGSVLHPFKYSLAQKFRQWFDHLEESHTPIFIGVFLIPIKISDDFSEGIGNMLEKHWKYITCGVLGFMGLQVFYFYIPKIFINIVCSSWACLHCIIQFLIDNVSASLVCALLLGYVTLMVFKWNPNNNRMFHYASMMMWLLLSCLIAKLFGSLQIPIFLVLQIILLGGFISEVIDIQQGLKGYTLAESLKFALQGKERSELLQDTTTNGSTKHPETDASVPPEELTSEEENTDNSLKAEKKSHSETSTEVPKEDRRNPWTLELFDDKPKVQRNASLLITDKGKVHIIKQAPSDHMPKVRRSLSQPTVGGLLFKNKTGILTWRRDSSRNLKLNNDDYGSEFYIYALLWGCGIIFFWRNLMFVPILLVPVLIFTAKHIGHYLGIWGWVNQKLNLVCDNVTSWLSERHDAIVPVPIRGLYKLVSRMNEWLKQSVKESIDTVASCMVIFGLIIFAICASIFIFIQVYAEAIMLVQMSSNVINQTVVHNPELRQLLPPTFESTIDSLLDNAYQYGREGISKAVKSVMSDVDPTKSAKLENQVLELFDRIYQTWMSSDNAEHGPKVTQDAIEDSWNTFIDDLQKSPEMLNLSGIMSFINQNVGTLLSLLDSVWSIVKGNISLLLGSFSAFVSVLLGGGTAVLNFILNTVIFLTTLFYLLSSSGALYKPVEIMTQFSTNGSRFGLALGDAINGVFAASFKMATFYGLWTWFIHNLFGVKIVYLPSAIAAILGAAPFLGSYWACIPAIFDLWLAQDKGFYAILFAAVQFLPMSVVDATIYAEMKGGHPYLTGLAIAGGIFCLGLEGAIIGPLVLCGLYVAIDLSTTLFKETPSEEAINLQQLSR